MTNYTDGVHGVLTREDAFDALDEDGDVESFVISFVEDRDDEPASPFVAEIVGRLDYPNTRVDREFGGRRADYQCEATGDDGITSVYAVTAEAARESSNARITVRRPVAKNENDDLVFETRNVGRIDALRAGDEFERRAEEIEEANRPEPHKRFLDDDRLFHADETFLSDEGFEKRSKPIKDNRDAETRNMDSLVSELREIEGIRHVDSGQRSGLSVYLPMSDVDRETAWEHSSLPPAAAARIAEERLAVTRISLSPVGGSDERYPAIHFEPVETVASWVERGENE